MTHAKRQHRRELIRKFVDRTGEPEIAAKKFKVSVKTVYRAMKVK